MNTDTEVVVVGMLLTIGALMTVAPEPKRVSVRPVEMDSESWKRLVLKVSTAPAERLFVTARLPPLFCRLPVTALPANSMDWLPAMTP